MKKYTFYFAALTALAMLNTSCSKDFETSETGLKYLFHEHDEEGKLPKLGDVIEVHMVGKSSTDSTIFDTYKNGQPFIINVMEPTFKGSLEEGFMMMAKGDSATFKINADSLFTKTFQRPRPEFVPAGSDVTFTLKMVNVMTSKEMEEKVRLENEEKRKKQEALYNEFLKGPQVANYKKTASGLMYEITKTNAAGKGVKDGDSVQVHYTGKLLNGETFDSSVDRGEPVTFPIGQGAVIPGWEEGVKLMKEGEKINLVIPQELAYGERGAGGRIPPYAAIMFEIELIKVK
ncbi:MAG: FKBP-type peptidyl-prolyl cis-trans isomerase [Bacteroidia bacterium]